MAFEKKKPGQFPLIFEKDKRETNSQSKLKQFNFNLRNFYENYILKKYFTFITEFVIKRIENKRKMQYLENIFDGRAAMCIFKIWQLKSVRKIQKYRKIVDASIKFNMFIKKKKFSELLENLNSIVNLRKQTIKAENYFTKSKRTKIFKILKRFAEKKKKSILAKTLFRSKIILKVFSIWKRLFKIKQQNRAKFIKNKDKLSFLIKKRFFIILLSFY